VLAHLIGDYYEKRKSEAGASRRNDRTAQRAVPIQNGSNPLTQAVCDALREVIGTYGLAVVCADQPTPSSAPGAGHHSSLASAKVKIFWPATPTPLSGRRTRKRLFTLTTTTWHHHAEGFDVINLGADTANVQISNLEFSQEDAVRGKYEHFMLKEIFEQRAPWKMPCAAAWTRKAPPRNSAG